MLYRNRGGALIISLPIIIAWWPAHYFFKWVRSKGDTDASFALSFAGCMAVSFALIRFGVWLGNNNPEIRSLRSSADINLMWLPFALISLGIWAGFLSGYMGMKKWS